MQHTVERRFSCENFVTETREQQLRVRGTRKMFLIGVAGTICFRFAMKSIGSVLIHGV